METENLSASKCFKIEKIEFKTEKNYFNTVEFLEIEIISNSNAQRLQSTKINSYFWNATKEGVRIDFEVNI